MTGPSQECAISYNVVVGEVYFLQISIILRIYLSRNMARLNCHRYWPEKKGPKHKIQHAQVSCGADLPLICYLCTENLCLYNIASLLTLCLWDALSVYLWRADASLHGPLLRGHLSSWTPFEGTPLFMDLFWGDTSLHGPLLRGHFSSRTLIWGMPLWQGSYFRGPLFPLTLFWRRGHLYLWTYWIGIPLADILQHRVVS